MMGVYRKVPRDVAKKIGCTATTRKWLDTNKGDESRPNFRSRLVGREVKHDNRLDLLSGTPPLETLTFLCSMCARRSDRTRAVPLCRYRQKSVRTSWRLHEDRSLSRSQKDLVPRDEGCVGQWQLNLYGTRDAAHHWAHEYTTFLFSLEFQVGHAPPCNFKRIKPDAFA